MPHAVKHRAIRKGTRQKHKLTNVDWLDGEKFGPYVSKTTTEVTSEEAASDVDDDLDLASVAPAAHDAMLALLGAPVSATMTRKRKRSTLTASQDIKDSDSQQAPSNTIELEIPSDDDESADIDLLDVQEVDTTDDVEVRNLFNEQYQNVTVHDLQQVKASYENRRLQRTTTQFEKGLKYLERPRSHEENEDHILKTVFTNVKERLKKSAASVVTALQSSDDATTQSYLSGLFSYSDVCLVDHTTKHINAFRDAYCLHSLNHLLRTRDLILKNNAKLASGAEQELEARDQGFTRTKVLILLPTRDRCLRTIERLITMIKPEQVENRKRLQEQFGFEGADTLKDTSKPADFKIAFAGNTDDNFRIGIKLTRQTVKLFSAFYSSDIILASPLGLKMAIDGKDKQDYDFLSSIEVVIVDDASALNMQNWQHIQYCFEHINLLPKESHGCDYSRIRHWCLEELSVCTRQLICSSDHEFPELRSLVQSSLNRSGRIRVQADVDNVLSSSGRTIPHVFQRLQSATIVDDPQSRFEHFESSLLPRIKKHAQASDAGILICFASYFDFVRVRNLLESRDLHFSAISEYSTTSELTRARHSFAQGNTPILMMTERLHHYRRYDIKGIKRLYFYQIPQFARYYKELVQAAMANLNTGQGEVRSLYSQWDAMSLERIVGGGKRLRKMLTGTDSIFDFR